MPPRLDLDDYNVIDLTVAEARGLIDQIEIDALDTLITELDKAQGDVFSGQAKLRYLILRIVP